MSQNNTKFRKLKTYLVELATITVTYSIPKYFTLREAKKWVRNEGTSQDSHYKCASLPAL